jgi:hypothetical protein
MDNTVCNYNSFSNPHVILMNTDYFHEKLVKQHHEISMDVYNKKF